MHNIGICGAHRTGKTRLAIALSKALSLPFVFIGTSDIFAKLNLDPAKPMDFRTRLFIQCEILKLADSIWFEKDQPFICDRTPIDMMAYTLAEVGGATLDKELEWELADYLRDCKRATDKYFSYLFLVPPAIPLVNETGKASLSQGYIEHIHRLCVGYYRDSESMFYGSQLPRSLTDLTDRVNFVKGLYNGQNNV